LPSAAMARTPWGDARKLRSRQLPAGRGTPREESERSQRERLFAAMVAVSAERGYEAMTVADLVALSAVSRADFYQHFADKRACFTATLEAILERAMGVVALRYDGQGSALSAFIDLIVDQPAAARLCFVEAYGAGPGAVEKMDGAVGLVESLYGRAFAARPGGAEMPAEITGAIVGGLRKVIYTRLRRGQEAELSEMAGQLWEWSFSYEAPAQPLRRPPRQGGETEQPKGEHPTERIVRAATETVVEKGYQGTTIADIVAAAAVSLTTFYRHFDGKDDVLTTALDASQGRLFEMTLPAYKGAADWPAAVRSAFETMFALFTEEPAFARLALVEIYAAGASALDRRDRTIDELVGFLAPGYERSPEVSPVAAEAIGGAIQALLHEQVCRHGPESLPELAPTATYLTLAPFLGAEEACAVANGEGPD
jgi:AcrR family transcriptional regulator